MPIIAQIMIPMKVGEDGLQTPIEHLVKAMRSINGVVCNESNVCCATDIAGFADKLKKFWGDL